MKFPTAGVATVTSVTLRADCATVVYVTVCAEVPATLSRPETVTVDAASASEI